jgi:hypothetical protein
MHLIEKLKKSERFNFNLYKFSVLIKIGFFKPKF